MNTSAIAITAICVIGVLALLAWIFVVGRASRRPHEPNPQRGQLRGTVQGGMHVGGGRSVAPTRDAPVPEGGGEPPAIEDEVAEHERLAARRGQEGRNPGNSGSPMDL
jgi:hypothetical protein